MFKVALQGPTDRVGFRRAVRALVARGVEPAGVRFGLAADADELFGGEPFELDGSEPPPLRLPAGFAALADEVLLHDDPGRFGALYAMAWRLVHGEVRWADRLDDERVALERMAQAVRREIHKLHAFVRFKPLTGADGSVEHVAWFEPGHHVVEAAAPFFARRFSNQRWALLTPRGSVRWDGVALQPGPPAGRDAAPPADAGEALWLAYYRSIFNPARLKVAMMKREMPVRFWPALPEAAAIAPLVAQAGARQTAMLAAAPTVRERRRTSAAASVAVPAVDGLPPLQQLEHQARRCSACAFAVHATQMVWSEGEPGQARLMLVGEQPGDREDLEGRPSSARPALLRATIAALGWRGDQLYLTNAVKHFKFEWRGKRRLHKTAGQREAQACADWLEAEIAIVQPRAIVALGATAARSLLGREVAIGANAGQWLPRADGVPVLIAAHPSSLLRAAPEQQPVLRAQWQQALALASVHLRD